jgi:hypothetical protein
MSLKKQSNVKDKKHPRMGILAAKDKNQTFVVSLPWKGQSEYWWNEACADVIEVFGLPGDRYTSHPTTNNMDFYFRSEKDYQLCKILLSDKIGT